MANEVKNYFLAPSWDYITNAQAGQTIALWNLVTSPTEMVPPLLAAKVQPRDDDILKSTKTTFEWTRESGGEKKFGVWAKFLQTVGLGASPLYRRKTSTRFSYKFDSIETHEAYPSHEYVEQMVKDPSVIRYLKKTSFKRPLYIVVGIKAVSGATVQQVRKTEIATILGVTAEVIPVGADMSLGSQLAQSSNTHETIGFKGPCDFIFAFRLRRVKINGRMVIQDDGDEREGTALGEDGDPIDDGIDVSGIEDSDVRAATLAGSIGCTETETEDEGEKVYVAVPPAVEDGWHS